MLFVRSRAGVSSLLAASLVLASAAPVMAQQAPGTPPVPPPAPPGATPAPPPAAPAAVPSSPPNAMPMQAPSSVTMAPPSTTMLAAPWPPPEGPSVQFAPDDAAARLERWEYSTDEKQSTWKLVCAGPCTRPMDTRFAYRVAGDKLVTSTWFQLPRSKEALTLKADTGGKGMRTAGEVLVWGGPVIAVVGVVLLASTRSSNGVNASATTCAACPPSIAGDKVDTSRSAWDTRTYVGTAVLGVGLATLFTGLGLIGASSTSATADRASASSARFKLSSEGFRF